MYRTEIVDVITDFATVKPLHAPGSRLEIGLQVDGLIVEVAVGEYSIYCETVDRSNGLEAYSGCEMTISEDSWCELLDIDELDCDTRDEIVYAAEAAAEAAADEYIRAFLRDGTHEETVFGVKVLCLRDVCEHLTQNEAGEWCDSEWSEVVDYTQLVETVKSFKSELLEELNKMISKLRVEADKLTCGSNYSCTEVSEFIDGIEQAARMPTVSSSDPIERQILGYLFGFLDTCDRMTIAQGLEFIKEVSEEQLRSDLGSHGMDVDDMLDMYEAS